MDEERLIVSLEARIRDFEKNMAKAERRGTRSYKGLRRDSRMTATAMERDMIRSTTRVNQALASTTSRIGAFGKAFAATAIAGGVAWLSAGIKTVVSGMADLDRMARRAGVSVSDFQELKFVAEQNRIDVDQLVDGLKELSIRADEFVTTGKGPAAEAFQRLGYGARDLERALEDPKELFADIIGRMEDLDRAAQIRVADELFGGTAGERFVELMGDGERGVRDLIDRARDLGLVMDESAIAKAAELDRKFAEIGARVSNLGKLIVVNVAGALEDALTIDVDEIFGSAERAIAMMGQEAYDEFKKGIALTKEQEGTVRDLIGTYDHLFRRINAATGPDGIRLMDVADSDTALALVAILQDIETAMQAFKTGSKSADEFEGEMTELVSEAETLLGDLSDIDKARFDNVVSAIGGISAALAAAVRGAASLRDTLPGRELTYSGRGGDPRLFDGDRTGTPLAPGGSPRPRLPGVNSSFGAPSQSGGRSGGSSSRDSLAAQMQRTREAIALWEAEAVAIAAVAAGGKSYGDALEFARKKAELLFEAQQSGTQVTPELAAEIDQLAKAYAVAGEAADAAADRIERVEDTAQRGADRMSDLFLSVMNGSISAKDALKQLLAEFLRFQVQSTFRNLASVGGGGGVFSILGELLGFDQGGYTGAGGVLEPAGLVHKGEYVVRASEVAKPGVRPFLDALNSGLPGFARGGLVPGGQAVPTNVPGSQWATPTRVMSQIGPQSISVDVAAANGDNQIRAIVTQAVAQGMQIAQQNSIAEVRANWGAFAAQYRIDGTLN